VTENERLKELLADTLSCIDLAKAGCLSTKTMKPVAPGECNCVACEIQEVLSLPAPEKIDEPVGCGDNSCIFGLLRTKGGMGTNGGCRCFENLINWNEKTRSWNREEVRKVRRATMMLVAKARNSP
jgi:hypothetical protein